MGFGGFGLGLLFTPLGPINFFMSNFQYADCRRKFHKFLSLSPSPSLSQTEGDFYISPLHVRMYDGVNLYANLRFFWSKTEIAYLIAESLLFFFCYIIFLLLFFFCSKQVYYMIVWFGREIVVTVEIGRRGG